MAQSLKDRDYNSRTLRVVYCRIDALRELCYLFHDLKTKRGVAGTEG